MVIQFTLVCHSHQKERERGTRLHCPKAGNERANGNLRRRSWCFNVKAFEWSSLFAFFARECYSAFRWWWFFSLFANLMIFNEVVCIELCFRAEMKNTFLALTLPRDRGMAGAFIKCCEMRVRWGRAPCNAILTAKKGEVVSIEITFSNSSEISVNFFPHFISEVNLKLKGNAFSREGRKWECGCGGVNFSVSEHKNKNNKGKHRSLALGVIIRYIYNRSSNQCANNRQAKEPPTSRSIASAPVCVRQCREGCDSFEHACMVRIYNRARERETYTQTESNETLIGF